MSSKSKIICIVIIALVAIGVIAFFITRPSSTPTSMSSSNQIEATGTRAPVPAGVTVPSQGEATAPNVAPPQVVSPAKAGSDSEYRSFSITADDNQFTPSTIVVNQGDVVNLIITAVDKNYDFTQPDYGFKQVAILKGQSKTIQFGATATGQFTFYCSSCGGPTQGPTGYIIIVPK